MQIFEEIFHKEDERAITGFINSSGDLEYNIYKCVDGGFIDLRDRKYEKGTLANLLSVELDTFIEMNQFTTTIIGHNIRIVLGNGKLVSLDDVDEEVYDISQSILDGSDCGDIFIESKKEEAHWVIVQ